MLCLQYVIDDFVIYLSVLFCSLFVCFSCSFLLLEIFFHNLVLLSVFSFLKRKAKEVQSCDCVGNLWSNLKLRSPPSLFPSQMVSQTHSSEQSVGLSDRWALPFFICLWLCRFSVSVSFIHASGPLWWTRLPFSFLSPINIQYISVGTLKFSFRKLNKHFYGFFYPYQYRC